MCRRLAALTVLLSLSCGGQAPPPAAPVKTYTAPNAAVSPSPPPPASPREDISATLHGILVEDPYRWLEKATAPAVQSWVTAQNGYARKLLDALPTQQDLTRRFTELLYFDAVSPPELRGG